jgi:signal-transduction protein with cAMP-binding, CBS, and nucleotidyltransferase domain
MVDSDANSVLIADSDGRLVGIVTEQDVTRRIAMRAGGEQPLRGVMTSPVRSVREDDYLYTAIAVMRRFGWRHMPVVDADGGPLGMIRLKDALAVAAEQSVALIERLTHEGTIDGLREVKAAQVEVAEALADDNVPAPEIQALISEVNRDIHRRILDARIAEMREEGRGDPPAEFCLIIMGSGGRGENFLYPDQDNGFIIDDYPDEEHDRIDGYFTELADRMTRDLDAVGLPLCKGYVMAVNPLWRKTRSQWRQQIGIWIARKSFVAVRLSDIFFDFRGAYGALAMARELRETVTEAMARPEALAFLQEVQRESGEYTTAIGWFNRFITVRDDPKHKGEINLKHTGTLPLVENVRLLSLRHGVAETSTLGRVAALAQRGHIDADVADYLDGAYQHITRLLLRAQIDEFRAGKKVDNYLDPKTLSKRERDMLVDSFKAIDKFQGRVRGELTADVF